MDDDRSFQRPLHLAIWCRERSTTAEKSPAAEASDAKSSERYWPQCGHVQRHKMLGKAIFSRGSGLCVQTRAPEGLCKLVQRDAINLVDAANLCRDEMLGDDQLILQVDKSDPCVG